MPNKPLVSINISGPENSGKSTLMKIIATLLSNKDFYEIKEMESDNSLILEDDFHIIKINTENINN